MAGILSSAKALAKQLDSTAVVELPSDEDFNAAIGYEPRELQAELDSRDRRFNVNVLHRRFGKTVREVAKLMRMAVDCPHVDGRYAYFAPTYAAAEDIAWLYLSRFHTALMESCGRDPEPLQNMSRLAVHVPTRNGGMARIRLYGLDSPKQRIRGLYLDGAVFDEFAWIPWSAWTQQVRPMLADTGRSGNDASGRRNQWADFIFTPFGRNHAHKLYQRAKLFGAGEPVRVENPMTGLTEDTFSEEWQASLYKASETNLLTRAELASMLADMGRSKYEQELECSFDAAVEGAIFAKELDELRQRGRIQHMPVNPLLPVNTAWDLGFDDATAIWFFQQRGEEVRLVDYYEVSGASLPHIASALAERNYRYGYHLLPHDVANHEMGTGKSRRSILRELGVRVTTVPRVAVKNDAIAAAQALLPRGRFAENETIEGVDRLALYRREYDEKNQVFRAKPVHDWASHGADAFETLATGLRRMREGDSHSASDQGMSEL